MTFPIGPIIGKVVKLGGLAPVKFELQGLYVPVYPAHDGERFIVQFNIIPVVAAPISGGPMTANSHRWRIEPAFLALRMFTARHYYPAP